MDDTDGVLTVSVRALVLSLVACLIESTAMPLMTLPYISVGLRPPPFSFVNINKPEGSSLWLSLSISVGSYTLTGACLRLLTNSNPNSAGPVSVETYVRVNVAGTEETGRSYTLLKLTAEGLSTRSHILLSVTIDVQYRITLEVVESGTIINLFV